MSKAPTAQLRRGQRLAVMIAPWVIRLLASTWRIQVFNEEGWRTRRREGKPFILSLWHGHMLPLLFHHRGQGVHILISEHRDGELIAQIAERFGLATIRGSTSRGAARALLEMSRALDEGKELAVTPDGPRGPAYTFAPGAAIISQRTGQPIVPIGVAADRAWRLKSWDAFMIPKPFTKIWIVYGDPIFVDAPDARSAADQAESLSLAMNTVVTKAQMMKTHPEVSLPV